MATNHPHPVVSIRWGSTSNEQEIHHDQQYSFTATSSIIRSDSDDASGILRHGMRTEQRFGLLTEAISEDPKVVWTGWPTLLRPDDHTLDLEEAPALSRSCATLMTHRMGGFSRKSSSALRCSSGLSKAKFTLAEKRTSVSNCHDWLPVPDTSN